jgi:Rhodopirellula transposase DDE domain
MTLKYCHGSARFAETVLGWSRDAIEVGLAEQRTGIRCVGAPSAWSGGKRWEEKDPEAASALRELAEAHAQQDPTLRTTLA